MRKVLRVDLIKCPCKLTQKKLDMGVKLSKVEEKLITAQNQMKEDLSKQGAERIRFKRLKEDHESILAGERLIVEIEAEEEEDKGMLLSEDEEEAIPKIDPTVKVVQKVNTIDDSEVAYDMAAGHIRNEDQDNDLEAFHDYRETSQKSSSNNNKVSS